MPLGIGLSDCPFGSEPDDISPHNSCGILQALDQNQTLNIDALEEMLSEAERMPMRIPEAVQLQGRWKLPGSWPRRCGTCSAWMSQRPTRQALRPWHAATGASRLPESPLQMMSP